MIFRTVGSIILFSTAIFSVDMGYVDNELRECQNYSEVDSLQQGIFDWIASVDNIEECNIEQINFLSSNRNRLTVKSNLSLLKSKYEFCNGVESLGRAFTQRESKLSNMKENCKGHNLNSLKDRVNIHHGEIIELQGEVDDLMDDMDR